MWHVVLLVVLQLSPALSIDSRFDEYLWTKELWNDFKLHKPRDRWRIEDAPSTAQYVHSLRQRCDFISADGPGVPKRDTVKSEEAYGDWLSALVDRVVAGAAVFGSVCSSAVEGGFEAVLGDIYEDALPSLGRIRILVEDVCIDTVDNIIKKFTLKREMRQEGAEEWKLEERRDEDEGSYGEEVEAAELACDRFMHQRRGEFVRALHEAAIDIDRELKTVVEWQLNQARGEIGSRREMEGKCEDIHPKCEEWADNGECVRNPSYMLKMCKISCGICDGVPSFEKSCPSVSVKFPHRVVFSRVGVFSLGAYAIERLHKRRETLIDRLQQQLCPQLSHHERHVYPIQEVKYDHILQGKEIDDISRALILELGDKCFLLSSGWWSYEICFFSTIRQLHYDRDGETVLISNLIGSFSEQRTLHIHPLVLQKDDMEKLGLVGERRAYVLQSYENGDKCGDSGMDRSAVIRLLCSEGLKQPPLSSNSIGIAVDEPEACHYVIHIFLPLVCHYPDYTPFPSVNKER